MLLFKRSLLLFEVLLAATIPNNAQTLQPTSHPVSVAFTYQVQRSNTVGGNSFWLQGGGGEISAELYHGFGITMNIAGIHAKNISNSAIDQSSLIMTFGPRYTWHPHSGRFSFFGQTLIGEAHSWDSVFPAATGATSTYDTFALQIGGGIDARITRRIAIRPMEANWLRTQYPNGTTNVQNSLRLGAGIVLRMQ